MLITVQIVHGRSKPGNILVGTSIGKSFVNRWIIVVLEYIIYSLYMIFCLVVSVFNKLIIREWLNIKLFYDPIGLH